MLGDAHNRRVLRSAIEQYISLRRYEQMSVHQAMQGLRTSALPFLWGRNAPGVAQRPWKLWANS